MTNFEIEKRVRMYSNETLRELAASARIQDRWFKIAARDELARRDFVAVFEYNPTFAELQEFKAHGIEA